ncbi:MAG: hypothetical protein V1861_04005 [Candidatus Micrarchaeota archaeon]
MGLDGWKIFGDVAWTMVMLPVSLLILIHPMIIFIIAYQAGIIIDIFEAMMIGAMMELALAALFLVFLKEKKRIPERLLSQSVTSAINMLLMWFMLTPSYTDDKREEFPMELASIALVSSLIWTVVMSLAVFALSR